MRRRTGIVIALVVAGLAMAVVTGWGALVLFSLAPGPSWLRSALAWSFVALGLVALAALAGRRVHINAAAQAADQAPDFSRRIRAWLP